MSENIGNINKPKPRKAPSEWSLKGKLISSRNLQDIIVDAELNKYIFGSTDEIERERILNKEFGYTKQDIETLRQKIIEDIDECVKFWKEDTLNSKELREHYIDAFLSCKRNINKRFGIE